jgi:excisionase family DNA binding protein
MAIPTRDLMPPSEEMANTARQAMRALAPLLRDRPSTIVLRPDTDGRHQVTVPLKAFELFVELLGHLANGKAVTVLPIHAELTTQEAADLLNVSRPYVVQLVDQGKLACHKVGTHRRIPVTELVRYKQEDDERRKKALADMVAADQADGLDL